jgi:hypothetical protein
MATGIVNDYFFDPVYEGATDWVVTFPMRTHGIYNGQFTSDCSEDGDATEGTVQVTTSSVEGGDTCFVNNNHIVYKLIPYDREGQYPTIDEEFEVGGISAYPSNRADRVVNVLQLGENTVLGSGSAKVYGSETLTVGVAGGVLLSFGDVATSYGTNASSALYTDQSESNNASFIADDVASNPTSAGISECVDTDQIIGCTTTRLGTVKVEGKGSKAKVWIVESNCVQPSVIIIAAGQIEQKRVKTAFGGEGQHAIAY